MNETQILDYVVQAVILILMLSMLPIVVAVLVGLIVSLLQALTQVQEQTLSFACKLIAVTITLLLAMKWVGAELYNYSLIIFEQLPLVGR